jgi:hypothetical protein
MGTTYWYARAADSATPSGPFHTDPEAVELDEHERLRPIDGSVVDGYRDEDTDTCSVVKNDGDVCGRELPCPYHDGE